MTKISKIESQIASLRNEIKLIVSQCSHLDYELNTTENFKFEHNPVRICVVCNKHLSEISEEDKRQIWEDFFEDFDNPQRDELINKALLDGGYNYP